MSIIDNAKSLAKLAQAVGNIELYQQVVDFQSQVTSIAGENFDLKNEMLGAKQKIAELEEVIRIKGSVEFRKDAYYLKKDDGSEDGPFCMRCLDADHRLIRCTTNNHLRTPICPQCAMMKR